MDVVAGTNGCIAQKRNPHRDGWTKTKRTIFLDQLEASCNIRQSAAAAGMTDGTARALRRRDPDFAAAWAEALEIGCERLRAELLARALERRGDRLHAALGVAVAGTWRGDGIPSGGRGGVHGYRRGCRIGKTIPGRRTMVVGRQRRTAVHL